MHISDDSLHEYLLGSGTLSMRDVAAAKAHAQTTGNPLSVEMLNLGLISQEGLQRAFAGTLGIPFVRLQEETLDYDALARIPEPLSRAASAVAYHVSNDGLEVALLDIEALPAIVALNGEQRILPRLTDLRSIKTALLAYQRRLRRSVGEDIAREAGQTQEPNTNGESELRVIAQGSPVSNLVDLLLRHALLNRATEMHLDQAERGLVVRYRIAGKLCDAMLLPKRAAAGTLARLKMLARVPLVDMHPHDGRFKIVEDGSSATIVLASAHTVEGERVVLHIIPQHAGRDGFTLEALGFRGQALERTHVALAAKSGFVLVCGEAGAGKTTTLYTLLDLLASPEKNIVAVEQETECRIASIVQMQPRKDIGLTFAGTVRAALKQDPDVLMVGEIAEEDIATLAVSAANRGVLVLAGIEAHSAALGVAKLTQLAPRAPLASVLRAAVGVARVQKLCDQHGARALARGEMREIEHIADPARVLLSLKEHGVVGARAAWKEVLFATPEACALCEKGYAGHIGLQEVLPATEHIKELIRGATDAETVGQSAREEGMLTILEDGIAKAVQGTVALADVLSSASVAAE